MTNPFRTGIAVAAMLLASLGTAQAVDTAPPVTTTVPDGIAGDNGWWRSDVLVALRCTDETGCSRTLFSVDGSTFADYAEPFAVRGDGIHSVRVSSTDRNGNIEPVAELLVKIDTVAPAGSLDRPAAGAAYALDQQAPLPVALPYTVAVGGDLTVLASAADGTSGVDRVAFFVDGALRATDREAPFAWAWPADEEPLGNHLLEVVAYDVAGNLVRDGLAVVTVPTTAEGARATIP